MFRLGLRTIRKGQAAMEFLMTYGWTILAVILVLGTLGYFSFFNSDKLLPDNAILESPFYAIAGAGDEDSINLGIRNNGDQTYTITEITIPNCGSYVIPFDVTPGETADVSVQCNNPLVVDTRFRSDIQIKYHGGGSTINQNAEGTISTNIQNGIGVPMSPGTPLTVCGNNVIEEDEACDGTDLGGKNSCADGTVFLICGNPINCPYVGPSLTCAPDCTAYSTEQCQRTECSDEIDNDGNGKMDFPGDVGCTNANDNDESIVPQMGEPVECEDGEDNDGDLFLDYPEDPGCSSQFDSNERGTTQCDDGIDNDNDNQIDYPQDVQCTGPSDNEEGNELGVGDPINPV